MWWRVRGLRGLARGWRRDALGQGARGVTVLAAFSPWGTVSLPLLAGLLLFAFVAGSARGFSGFGAGLIFIPLASALIGPQKAAALLLITDLVGALPTIPPAWRQAERGPVLTMILGALVGMPLGLAALLIVDPVVVRWGICVIVLGLLGLLISGWRWSGPARAPALLAAGGLGGILSGLAQIGGPPVVAFWLGMPRPLAVLRANIMLYFALTSIASLVFYGFSGLIGAPLIGLAVVVIPAYMGGVMLGMRLFGLADPAVFRALSMALIALAAVLGLPVWG